MVFDANAGDHAASGDAMISASADPGAFYKGV
jgi:hypothetical protein